MQFTYKSAPNMESVYYMLFSFSVANSKKLKEHKVTSKQTTMKHIPPCSDWHTWLWE